MKANLIYSTNYDLSLFGLERLHPFDVKKYRRAWEIVRRALGEELDRYWIEPKQPVSEEQLLRVHTSDYLESLSSSAVISQAFDLWSARLVPNSLLQSRILRPMRFAVEGTILAASKALEGAIAMNFGGGYHHAFREHGEGFSIYADVAIAIAAQRAQGKLKSEDRVLVVDLDAHRGNGFATISEADPAIQIFDMYNFQVYPGSEDNYDPDRTPFVTPLKTNCDDTFYFKVLERDLPAFLDGGGSARLAFYNAGTDVVAGDRIGRLGITPEGVRRRDRYVIDMLVSRGIPTVIVTSGGYTAISHKLIADMALYLVEKLRPAPGSSEPTDGSTQALQRPDRNRGD